MAHSHEPLYTLVATEHGSDNIVACVVGSFVSAVHLSKATQQLLLNRGDPPQSRLFYIMTLGTIPSHRRSGLATALIQECMLTAARETLCSAIYLHVLPDNLPAIRLYENLGFDWRAEIPDYYKISGQLYSCYVYAKRLPGTFLRFRLGSLLLHCVS
jgi:ribosomal protein S18 acetylase RimI-like enzyme